MDDVCGKVEVFPQHFQPIEESEGSTPTNRTTTEPLLRPRAWALRRVMGAASLLNLLSLPRLRWSSSSEEDDKVELTKVELESLRSEIVDAEERETHLKARLEILDELLKSARLAGYLFIRTRWTALPGEPPILDDGDVDDWLPRFVVLQGPCMYYYLKSADLSPQDFTSLADVIEIGTLPAFWQEDQQTRYAFYILTRHGLRIECSSTSEIWVDSWLRALRTDCKLRKDATTDDTIET